MRKYILFGLLVGIIALSACAPRTSTVGVATTTTSSLPTEQNSPTLTPKSTSEPYVIVDTPMYVRNGPNLASPPTPTSEIIPACTPATKAETVSEELDKARNALTTFFELLNQREYENAAVFYGGDYQGLRDSNPLVDPQDYVALLTNGCEMNGLQCLRVKRIFDEKVGSLAEYHFTVEFLNQDDSLFVLGPCCGGNATDFPPKSRFAYTVIRNCDGEFLVRELPVYVP